MIVLIGGEKGGTGKSTIATNLAAYRAAQGRDVLLVDTDKQLSASSWAEVRAEDGIKPSITSVSKFGKGLADELRNLAPRFDDVIIDSGGRDTIELRQAMLVATVMLVPARPSQADIQTLYGVDRAIGDAQAFNARLRAYLVVNCAPTHATNSDADDMIEMVREMSNLQIADTVIRDRVAFRRAYRDGRSVGEYQPIDEKAASEMKRLFKETFELETTK